MKAAEVAEANGWERAPKKIEKLNPNRQIYYDSNNKVYYSVDTQHGRLEMLNIKGKHMGEVNMDLNFKGKIDGAGNHGIRFS